MRPTDHLCTCGDVAVMLRRGMPVATPQRAGRSVQAISAADLPEELCASCCAQLPPSEQLFYKDIRQRFAGEEDQTRSIEDYFQASPEEG